MGFSKILDKTISDYKKNFRLIFKFVTKYYLILALVTMIIGFFLVPYASVIEESGFSTLSGEITGVYVFSIIWQIVMFFFGLFVSVGIISAYLKKDKFVYSDLIKSGKDNFWRYFAFSIVYTIFMILLFVPTGILLALFVLFKNFILLVIGLLLVIIPVIFLIYWVFGVYVFIGEKKGIIGSLAESYRIIKGKWWRTFGYWILITIIITIPFLIITAPFELLIKANIYMEPVSGFVSAVLSYLFMVPFGIFFFKNYYDSVKRKK